MNLDAEYGTKKYQSPMYSGKNGGPAWADGRIQAGGLLNAAHG